MKKFVCVLLGILFVSYFSAISAFGNEDLNRRLVSCTPSKDYNAGNSTMYQISGLTGSTCIYRIQYLGSSKPDLICKVPLSRMREMTSPNPIAVQRLKSQFCVMSMRKSVQTKSGIIL